MINAELDRSQFDVRAERLAVKSHISGNGSYNQLDYFGFASSENYYVPQENYQGKKILDVGAGVSDFTDMLLEKGADAYALDYGYKDLDEFLSRASGWWAEGQRFLSHYKENPQRYIYGLAHHLPFESNTFDAVTSYFGIFGAMDEDVDVAKACINDAIRVLKPDGILQIGPLLDANFTKEQKANQQIILDIFMERKDIDLEVRLPSGLRILGSFGPTSDMGKLTIVKSS